MKDEIVFGAGGSWQWQLAVAVAVAVCSGSGQVGSQSFIQVLKLKPGRLLLSAKKGSAGRNYKIVAPVIII